MQIQKFEEIIAWQKAKDLTKDIYLNLKNCKDYSFKDQIQRAAVSVLNNIAEGFERQTNKKFIHFLYIAKGSNGEVRSMLQLGIHLKYIETEKANILINKCTEISKIISGLIKTL